LLANTILLSICDGVTGLELKALEDLLRVGYTFFGKSNGGSNALPRLFGCKNGVSY
jgi:hypothetical protein